MNEQLSLIDPTIDTVFEHLVGHPERSRLLISLLTCILEPQSPIVAVAKLERVVEMNADCEESVGFWVLVTLQDRSETIVEMRAITTPCSFERLMYFWARAYTEQIHLDSLGFRLRPVSAVVVSSCATTETNVLHASYRAKDKETKTVCLEELDLHEVALPLIADPVALADENLMLQRWARFLGARSDVEREEVAKEDPTIAEALAALRELSENPVMREEAAQRVAAIKQFVEDWQKKYGKHNTGERQQGPISELTEVSAVWRVV